jgi:hypothetical protein
MPARPVQLDQCVNCWKSWRPVDTRVGACSRRSFLTPLIDSTRWRATASLSVSMCSGAPSWPTHHESEPRWQGDGRWISSQLDSWISSQLDSLWLVTVTSHLGLARYTNELNSWLDSLESSSQLIRLASHTTKYKIYIHKIYIYNRKIIF